MFDIRHFKRVFYIVILLGLLGYGVALESPAHLVIGAFLVLAHAWINRSSPQLAIPPIIASLAAAGSGAWTAVGVTREVMTPLMAISQWLFILMLITLWSRPSNRSYGQMLVMSLVLMVAGAINSASVVYGALLIAYLFLALYCCLLFHLKVETEEAYKAYNLSPDKVDARAIRHDIGYFNRSMRRLAVLVSLVSVTLGILVFLFFPRARNPGLLMQMRTLQPAPLTGFSDRVSFEQVARITQSPEIVAHVTITEDGQPAPPQDLYLRGLALDIYTGNTSDRPHMNWQWIRLASLMGSPSTTVHARAGVAQTVAPASSGKLIRQRILLQPTGTSSLFAIAGASTIEVGRDIDVQYSPVDGALRVSELLKNPIEYEVVSTGELGLPDSDDTFEVPAPPWVRQLQFPFDGSAKSQIDPRIKEYAQRPEVSGSDAQGSLATRRGTGQGPHPLDEAIANAISRHLKDNFRYTLDLTDTSRARGEDPLTSFLYDFKRGHCEYFAGAMTLMCQSLGMKARVVVGFRSGPEDYNSLAGYYIVRQSNAHAWVEVLTSAGWKTFDPTTSNSYFGPTGNGLFRRISDLFDYLQYKWAMSIVTYGSQDRDDLIRAANALFTTVINSVRSFVGWVQESLHSENAYVISSRLIGAAIAVSLLVLLLSIAMFIIEKHRLLRRAERIGISSLPPVDQMRLARQLAFYDDLLQLLARRRIHRHPSHTPEEFARSLDFLPPEAYAQICRLTRIFYRVRYGNRRVSLAHRRRLSAVIARLHETLTLQDPARIVIR